jgi:2-polyprenyl-3-methyl-5-hydroxy-6-metoxy-1,4-benzoquinol methylase
MRDDYEQKYHDIEKDHFWFKARRDYILRLLEKTAKQQSILDIGCSSGVLIQELVQQGFRKDNIYGIDISSKAIDRCRENGIKNAFVMDAQNVKLNKKFDIIIASDCLEHLKDDTKALKNWYQLLNDNGQLIVFVPAFMFLWSAHDDANMHYRRYTKNKLRYKLKEEGFTITKASYWNFLFFVPILIIRSAGRIFCKKKKVNVEKGLEKPPFNMFFYRCMRYENKLLSKINLPFGVSAFCIAKKS